MRQAYQSDDLSADSAVEKTAGKLKIREKIFIPSTVKSQETKRGLDSL
jgi:hypothetical protein